ncbi:hypothetical protein G7L40_21105 [Paenibacillus polymyxa]|uniref:Uncharacterized protein n=1 Tax=Paenibacillus polymyxa TaxID=1406 RepID=A0A378Y0N0_PAEPO|nr:hypothetical protein [Paenibacillus polymyxa]MBE7901082.1 hypothetical protein [Paenibacillus polymyxa]MBG9765080.1 hypothetical protein [Paenibacillus polymyxa]MCC3261563.1 hypothetical protein [Paenibacillus polymyxa]QPK54965.1 hypothetical protein G7035_21155 [Paenibacillus polymyxa]QPK60056.1 hypothetical protein G7L40_21105 [Paenibacillus polymyxa]
MTILIRQYDARLRTTTIDFDPDNPENFVTDDFIDFQVPIKSCWTALNSFSINLPYYKNDSGKIVNVSSSNLTIGLLVREIRDSSVRVHTVISVNSPELLERKLNISGLVSYLAFAETKD